MLESQIQSKIIKHLESNGWYVVKISLCSKNGWPDLQAHKNGITIFIECKRPGELPNTLQLFRHKELRDQGFQVFVIDDPKDFII